MSMSHRRGRDALPAVSRTVIVSSVASDAHTWNLVFLELLISELGYDVVNLGPCVPDQVLVAECRRLRPGLVVVSSVNGHGYLDGLQLIRELRGHPDLRQLPVVIGGKLGISDDDRGRRTDDLIGAGFDAVFDERADGTVAFRQFVAFISGGARRELR